MPEQQASQLQDPRLDVVQRQKLAAQIGRRHGNRYLARAVQRDGQPSRFRASDPVGQLSPPGLIQRDGHRSRRQQRPAYQPTYSSDAIGALRGRGYLVNPDSPVVAITPTQWADRPRTRRLRAAAPAAETAASQRLEGLVELQTTLRAELAGLEANLESMSPREQRQARAPNGRTSLTEYVGQLRRRLRRLVFEINAVRAELREAQALQQDVPPASLGNPNAVEVNLNHSGIQVRQKTGRQQPTSEWRLDPTFALAFVNFLEAIRNQGVTILYNQGFLRDPISPQDTHPQGMACDISGFRVHGHRLELSHDDSQSAWFDTTQRIPATNTTYREAIVAIAQIMPQHFGQIIGPGHNAQHMNHFHVQTRGTRRVHGLNAPGQPGSVQERQPFRRR